MDIFKIVGKIALDGTDEFNRNIDEAKGKGASLASAIGRGLGTVAKIGGAAIVAASAAMVAVGKSSLDAYAEFEQLVGGVDTLFKDSSATLQQYAQQAFMTAGLSANEYMATATSFSASLLQGLGGDTAKAAEYADMAIRDMADNANKMGTEISMIQNAYQGFAKQNFTMLDNLKLGYGGTRTEMERLLRDANRINKQYGITTNYTIDNLADIYEAINVVQREMGIYGTTLDEASETITGSLNATKAAWKNLIVGFADGNQELDVLIDNFVGSITTAAKNIVPRLAQILGGISEAMAEIIPVITEELPGLLAELLPGVIKGAGALIQGLVSAMPGLLVVLKDALLQVFGGIWDYIFIDLLGTDYDFSAAFSGLTKAAKKAWTEIQQTWNAIGQPIWKIIKKYLDITAEVFSKKMPEMVSFFADFCEDVDGYWNDVLQPCLQAIGDFIETYLAPVFEHVFQVRIPARVEACFRYISSMWNEVLLPVLKGITTFLLGVFTSDWETAFQGLGMTVEGLGSTTRVTLESIATYFATLLAPIIGDWSKIWAACEERLLQFVGVSEEDWEQIKNTIAEKIESILATATSKFDEIKAVISSRMNDVRSKVEEAFTNIIKFISKAMEEAKAIVGKMWEDVKTIFSDAIRVGQKIVSDIKEGIASEWEGLSLWFKGIWDGLFGNLTATVTINKNNNTGGTDGSHADGLSYVPFDGYIAELHKGEMVVPAFEASILRNGSAGSVATAEIASILTMILEAIQEGNNRDAVFTLNHREFARMVRGAASV